MKIVISVGMMEVNIYEKWGNEDSHLRGVHLGESLHLLDDNVVY